MLDDAIDYLKTLKLQLQANFQVQHFCCTNYICFPRLGLNLQILEFEWMNVLNIWNEMMQIMSMGSGLWPLMMGFRPPQLPIPPLSAITDSRLIQMFGSPNQIPPMPMPHAPFFPIIGNSATQSHLANNTTTTAAATTNLAEHLANSLHGNATKLAPPSQISFQHHHTSTSTPTLATPFIFPQK